MAKPKDCPPPIRFAAGIVFLLAMAAASAQPPAQEKSHAQMHHPQASQAAIALHDLMEPFWHAAASPERSAKVCQLAEEIKKRVKAAATRPTPDHDAMIGSSRALSDACAAKNESGVGAEIDRMHQLFYKIAK